jgi:hypothetical protein
MAPMGWSRAGHSAENRLVFAPEPISKARRVTARVRLKAVPLRRIAGIAGHCLEQRPGTGSLGHQTPGPCESASVLKCGGCECRSTIPLHSWSARGEELVFYPPSPRLQSCNTSFCFVAPQHPQSAIGSNCNVPCVTPGRRVSLAQRFQTEEPNR